MKDKRRALFIGRWQPCHKGHEWLIRQKLDTGIPVLIAVRDIEPDEKNPFTTEETVDMLTTAFEGEDAKVIVIPDIESVNWGRGVGYETNEHEPPPSIYNISATQIREQVVSKNNEWKEKVNSKIWDKIEEKLK